MLPAPPRSIRLLTALALIATVTALAVAVAEPVSARPAALVLLVDASDSMNDTAPSGRTKLAEVKEGLRAFASALPSGVPVGLRVFGPRDGPTVDGQSTWCRGTRTVVPVGPLDAVLLSAAADTITADGATPTGFALIQAAGDSAGATIVLISDGRDTCGPADPCAVARTLAGRDVPSRVHTIGVSLSEQSARNELRCIAEATGGTFAEALDAGSVARALRKAAAASGLTPARRSARGTPVRGTPDPTTAPGPAASGPVSTPAPSARVLPAAAARAPTRTTDALRVAALAASGLAVAAFVLVRRRRRAAGPAAPGGQAAPRGAQPGGQLDGQAPNPGPGAQEPPDDGLYHRPRR
jgi:Ca-activated chloride channel family protein